MYFFLIYIIVDYKLFSIKRLKDPRYLAAKAEKDFNISDYKYLSQQTGAICRSNGLK